MARKKTIPCDRCGARLDNIPEKCPHCGEIIRDRMDPFIREQVEKMMNPGWLKRNSPVLLTYLFFIPFAASIWFVHYSFDRYDILTAASIAAFAFVALIYYLVVSKVLSNGSAWILTSHGTLFISTSSAAATMLFPKSFEMDRFENSPIISMDDWVILTITSVATAGIIFLVWLHTRKSERESNFRNQMFKWSALMLLLVIGIVLSKDIWFIIEGFKLKHTESFWLIDNLGEIQDDRAYQTIVYALEKSENEGIRQYAAQKLGIIGDPRAVPNLIKALENDPSSNVRMTAATRLGIFCDKRAVAPLIRTLSNDSYTYVKVHAGLALGFIGDFRAMEPLLRALENDAEPEVRWSAAVSLASLGDESVVQFLLSVIENDSRSMARRGAAIALAWFQGNYNFSGYAADHMFWDDYLIRAVKARWGDLDETRFIMCRLHDDCYWIKRFYAAVITRMPDGCPQYDCLAKEDGMSKQIKAISSWYWANETRLAWDAEKRKYYLKP
jgi:hypothetical protein